MTTLPAGSPLNSTRKSSRLRQDLHACTGDGLTYSLMFGMGETFFAAFALALGFSDVVSGLIVALPPLAGAILQLGSPWAVRKLQSPQRWIMLCATVQALSFVPLIIGAIVGALPVALLFVVAALYWTVNLGAAAPWNTWVGLIFPERIRARYFGWRNRWCQLAILLGLMSAGAILAPMEKHGHALWAFALIFTIAGLARASSIFYLRRQADPPNFPTATQPIKLHHVATKFGRRPDATLIAFLVVMQLGVQVGQPYFNPYMLSELALGPSWYLALVAMSFAAKSATFPFWGWLAGKLGARRVLVASAVGVALLALPWLFLRDPWLLLAAQIFAGAMWGAFELCTFLLLLETIPAERRTAAMSGFYLLNAIAMVGGGLIGAHFLAADHSADGYATIFTLSTAMRMSALLIVPFIHTEVLHPFRIIFAPFGGRMGV
ncbi:MAG: MFS transporter, partial [Phycisphaerales bacterium]|nr:MFS transporter [Phycisphaerales bacterium]